MVSEQISGEPDASGFLGCEVPSMALGDLIQ
jgi:hypothetical protein